MTAGAGDEPVRDLAAEVPAGRSAAARLLLYANTIRHLRPSQVWWQLKRRARPPRPPARGPAAGWRGGVRFEPFVPPPEPAPEPGRIRFVGMPRPFDPARPDWQAADAPKLWRYNLHYFDFLGWHAVPPAQKRGLVADWIARVPVGAPDAWEPYPLSLRIVNWCKHGLAAGPGALDDAAVASLAHQAAALEGDLEYHLLANHLLKNGKALAMAGLCLDGPAADRWLATGLGILVAEARAEVLPDGGHVERSPMYHCIVLEDYLDVVNLLLRNPGRAAPATVAVLADAARRAAGFLRAILTGAGTIPLFNDAAHGITAPPGELLAYAERVLCVGAATASSSTAARWGPTTSPATPTATR